MDEEFSEEPALGNLVFIRAEDWGPPDPDFTVLVESTASLNLVAAYFADLHRLYAAEVEWQGQELTPVKELDEIFVFRDAPAVRSFLRAHPELGSVLLGARPLVEKHFGSERPVCLEVVVDPENAGGDQLFAHIHTSLSVKEALARLDEFDEEWFLHQLPQVRDQLSFDLEFT